jgi:Leucine-rich repeat (LRR) protein
MSQSIPTEDRISTLPDPILCHILSFVPTKLAATTSVLSKRWNPLWLFVETLHFNDKDFKNNATFRAFISSVFLLRDKMLPLRSFHLQYSDICIFYHHDISRFIDAAVQRKQIENLNLDMPYSFLSQFKLPHSIFSCKTLVVLNLIGIELKDLSDVVVDLPRLKTLHLSPDPFQRVDYLSKLLSGCPALEELHAALV